MNTLKTFALCVACLAALALTVPDIVDAARLGGGRSFGSSSAMRRPAAPPSGSFGGSSINRQTVPMQSNRMDGGVTSIPRANTGMFGGLFGGLLAGTMLGSLLGGHSTATGGTVGGFGFMDLLLLGLLVYFGVRFFRRVTGGNSARREDYRTLQNYGSQSSASSGWDNLRSKQAAAPVSASLPAGLDQEEFLRGAKIAYIRLQGSWDRRDLNDIAQFATESVMEELRRQAAEDPHPGKTELLLVTASILDVWDEGDERRVAVNFDVLMREDQSVRQPEQVREVWYFVCSNREGDSWKLDGIQQFSPVR